jgi:uncharacterized ion transporter superfamily protein YfcC
VIDLEKAWMLLDKGGTIGLAIFIVVAFVKGWIVPRWTYDRLERDHERMTQIAFKTIDLGERAATVAEKKVA